MVTFLYETYSDLQSQIDEKIGDLNEELKKLENNLKLDHEKLENVQVNLRFAHDSSEVIWLSSLEPKYLEQIEQTENIIANYKKTIKDLEKIRESNDFLWQKQVAVIEVTIESEIQRFIEITTSKIREKYHFYDFTHETLEYSDHVKNIVYGEYVSE